MQTSQGLVQTSHDVRQLIVAGKAMEEVRRLARRYAPHFATVLVTGESGVGKELIARMVHDESPFKSGPFIPVNCASIPESLFDSEISGFTRGAFTGADRDRKGLFESAAGGTLFLDEIGELPMACQPKLLRILQEGTVRPVGAHTERPVQVRTVVATNRNLEECIKNGTFRGDLYHRVNVLPINVPPLRERREDIPVLAEHFAAKKGKTFAPEALAMLSIMQWDGNVRELEHMIERISILAESDTITIADIDVRGSWKPNLLETASEVYSTDVQSLPKKDAVEPVVSRNPLSEQELFLALAGRMLSLEEVRKKYAFAVGDLMGFSLSRVGRAIGVSRQTLANWFREVRPPYHD